MSKLSRRTLLALCGGSAVALSGCSSATDSVTGGGEETDETRSTANDLQLTLEDAIITNRLGNELADDGNVIYLLDVTIRNNSEETLSPPQKDDMLIEDANEIRYGVADLSGEFTIPTEGEIATIPSSFDTGDEITGFIALEVEEEIEQPELVISIEHEETDDLRWVLPNSDEFTVDISSEIEKPEVYGRRDQLEFEITVANGGGRTARYDTSFEINSGTIEGAQEDETVLPIQTTLDGAESFSETIVVTTSADNFIATFEGEDVANEETLPAIFGFGEEVVFPSSGWNDLLGVVENVFFAEEYTTEDGTTETAPTQSKYLFAEIVNEPIEQGRTLGIRTGIGSSFPNIEVILGSDRIPMSTDGALIDPISSEPLPSRSYNLYSGDQETGYIVGEVPSELDMSEVTIEIARAGTRFRFTETGERVPK